MKKLVLTLLFSLMFDSIAFATGSSMQNVDSQWTAPLIIGLLGGAVAGSGLEVYRWFRRPKLMIDFETRNKGIVNVKWETKNKDGDKHLYDRLNAMLRIRNDGFQVAINCRVYLTGVEKYENETTTSTRYANSLQLSWPEWQFDPRTVYRKVPIYVELISIDKTTPEWLFQARGFQNAQPDFKDYHGTFRFTVVAVADNAQPSFARADVYFSGTHESLRIVNVSPLARTTWELISR